MEVICILQGYLLEDLRLEEPPARLRDERDEDAPLLRDVCSEDGIDRLREEPSAELLREEAAERLREEAPPAGLLREDTSGRLRDDDERDCILRLERLPPRRSSISSADCLREDLDPPLLFFAFE